MADAGFFRGTSSEQDGRFSDKEKKLLKLMKFEGLLETKINMRKVNLDVIKPWITVRINEILGVEDDVVIEYIISQLEAKEINPKIMQINITGFLNARHARQFMGELWALLNEAQEAEDGVPPSLVEKKMVEMKKEGEQNGTSKPAIKTLAQNDWAHRYQNLSLGRFSGTTKEKEVRDDRIVPRSLKSPDRRRSPRSTVGSARKMDRRGGDRDRERGGDRDRDRGDRDRERGDRGDRGDRERDRRDKQTDKEREIESKRREEERLKRRAAEKERDRKREEERDKRRHDRRRRSRTRSRSPPRRRFTEDSKDRKKKRKDSSDSESEVETKKEKKREKKRDDSSEDEKKEKDRKERKKHKKEKKKKERKRSPSPSSSDSDSD